MIDTQSIRAKILDLAMRGQLTEQLPEDGVAEILFQQIQVEKQKLINSGAIKKSKPLPEVTEEETPFEIPESWKWVRVGSITEIAGGTTPSASEISPSGTVPYYKVSDMNTPGNETHMIYASNYISKGYTGKIFPAGTTIFPKNGGAALTNKRRVLTVPSAVDLNTGGCTPLLYEMANWIRLFMETVDFGKMDTGSNIPTVNATNLKSQLMALPPLAEQQRIVERIRKAFSALDTIDALQAQYADNLTVLKSKLIDAAIQGKLTEQLPEDGTAEELYQLVQDERKLQEEAGKIKSVELAPVVAKEDQPFDIPATWKWAHLGNVSYIVRGGSPRPIKQYITTREYGINWIKIGDVEKGGKYIYSTHEKIIPEGESKSRRVFPGDFLLTNSMSFGRPYISKIEGCIHDGWLLIHDLSGFDPDYLYYLLSSSYLYGQFTVKASGSTVDNLNIDKVKAAVIPLPPLAEQKRIAQKIDELIQTLEK